MTEFPPRSILVPMDLSDASAAAWRQAVAMSERFGARLEAVYVAPSGRAMRAGAVELAAPGLAVPESDSLVASIKALVGGKAPLRRLEGPIDEAVASFAARRDFDLVVMGTHGRSGLDRLLMGSVAEAVIRRSSVPVLVARERLAPRQILAPYDGEPHSREGVLVAARVAEAFEARLTILHVIPPPAAAGPDALKGANQLLERAVAFLPARLRHASNPRVELALGDPAREVIAAAKEHDITVMMARGRGAFREVVLGSTIERVLRHSSAAVLTLPSRVARDRAGKAARREAK